ncbi:MAG: hypothetical protein JWP03_5404 [Phycisphaerales bacterium]|nr:hypothetical protein [Phycisphaerales bacterium]
MMYALVVRRFRLHGQAESLHHNSVRFTLSELLFRSFPSPGTPGEG